jgi:hypothetical protein
MQADASSKLLDFLFSGGLVALGWFLGWGAQIVREVLHRRKVKKALLSELREIDNRLIELEWGTIAGLQKYAHKIADITIPTLIQNPIYTHYFKDVCTRLNDSQRRGLNNIHAHIKAFNDSVDSAKNLLLELSANPSIAGIDEVGSALLARYSHIGVIRFHIQYYLDNPENPHVDIKSTLGGKFKNVVRDLRRTADQIVEDARSIDIPGEMRAEGYRLRNLNEML